MVQQFELCRLQIDLRFAQRTRIFPQLEELGPLAGRCRRSGTSNTDITEVTVGIARNSASIAFRRATPASLNQSSAVTQTVAYSSHPQSARVSKSGPEARIVLRDERVGLRIDLDPRDPSGEEGRHPEQ